jgi:hypothetical protein
MRARQNVHEFPLKSRALDERPAENVVRRSTVTKVPPRSEFRLGQRFVEVGRNDQ